MSGPEELEGFLGLPPERRRRDSSFAFVLPIPYEATTTYGSGTRAGPAAIIEASRNVEMFDEELLRDPSSGGIHTLAPIEPHTGGPEMMVLRIYSEMKRLLAEGKFILSLGGEHTVSAGAVKAFHEIYPDLTVLQVDAHLDLRSSYLGSPFNHACVMRRVIEICPAVFVAARAFSEEEHEFVKSEKLKTFTMRAIRRKPGWMKEVARALGKRVYVTFDLDGLDPSVMPSVGTPEPGGLSWEEAIDLLRLVFRSRAVVGADLVELAPAGAAPAAGPYTAARLAYKMLSYAWAASERRS